eukprot:TRINITY_DN29959_c0_g1_i1.p1 TRINITY_DN29959_c0_g1~~TRINITY_DN29959_c0_g1_i1.p1  ORF type:complete len:553 (+),score=80.19 TRINITY_DN29959_c0_g1_i1:73-1659(+)
MHRRLPQLATVALCRQQRQRRIVLEFLPVSRRLFSSGPDPRDAVVKIFNTRQRPGWTVPWQTQPVEGSFGSGAVIKHGTMTAILTAAHVVADTRYLQIQRSTDRFSSAKFRAYLLAVCHDIDLALLIVEDPSALEEIAPLSLGAPDALPHVFDKVHVVGYPVGGDAVSVTEGVVSRVEVQEFSHSLRPGLALTVDAAINSGNSGGPLLDGNTKAIVGVAFQKLVSRGVELQGHAVPAPMIHRFLSEVLDRKAEISPQEPLQLQLPALGWDFQPLEAPALRDSLDLDETRRGVLINRLHYPDEAPAVEVGDVMLSFNDYDLDDRGFCQIFDRRLHFAVVRDLCAINKVVPLRIWRDSREMTIEHVLRPTRYLVNRGQYDIRPVFYLCGGLIFQALTHEYLMGWSASDRPPHLQNLFTAGHLRPDRREAVMVSQILADEANAGYDSGFVGAPIVREVNNIPVVDLRHLARIVAEVQQAGTEKFLSFKVEMAGGPYKVVVPVDGLDDANLRVQNMYGLPDAGMQGRLPDDV